MYKETFESSARKHAEPKEQVLKPDDLLSQKEQKDTKTDTEAFLKSLPDVVCLSHLRWDFVYQRPQHLLSRFARHGRLFFVEEPMFETIDAPYMHTTAREGNVHVAVPHLPHGLSAEEVEAVQGQLLGELFQEQALERYIFWYYTPMALSFTEHFTPLLTVYDCMDELSAFKFAPPRLKELEQALFKKADLVFTGGQSLYEAKQHQHKAIFPFPSSIDKAHFAQAKNKMEEPADQASIPEPRLGFYGVLDERLDLELLGAVADARPDWQFVMIGPVVKVEYEALPHRPNIHYLGGKAYQELPTYLSGWDVALLPFAINESTAFISPTKTPEYLAAGKPVVSTPVKDVVRPYGDAGLVHIARTAEEFTAAAEKALAQHQDQAWSRQVETFMQDMSWDNTWQKMVELMSTALHQKVKS